MIAPVLGATQPQSDQVAAASGLSVVFERRAVVEDPAVAGEEHLPRRQVEFHPEGVLAKEFLQRLDCPLLFTCEGAPDAFVSDLDIIAHVSLSQAQSFIPAEDWMLGHGRLTFGYLSPAVKAEFLVERLEQI